MAFRSGILLYIKENVMDQNKLVIRNVIRIAGIIAGAGAIIAGFIFRVVLNNSENLQKSDPIIASCVVARICAIVLFAAAAAFLIFDVVTKAYPISISAAGLGVATIAFVGNFIMAPASSKLGLVGYVVSHMVGLTKFNATTLFIGSYLVIAGGFFFASYSISCIKKGK